MFIYSIIDSMSISPMIIDSEKIIHFEVLLCSVPARLDWRAECWGDVVGDKFSQAVSNVLDGLTNKEENFYIEVKKVLEQADSIEIYKSDENGLKSVFEVK